MIKLLNKTYNKFYCYVTVIKNVLLQLQVFTVKNFSHTYTKTQAHTHTMKYYIN